MDKILHYIASFATGGQSDFLIPLSHDWHGMNVAPFLDIWAVLGTFAAITLLGVGCWKLLRRHPAASTFLYAVFFATVAYAASSTLSNLSAGSAISDTDIFYDVQTAGTGGVKVTGAQVKTYIGQTTINTGCQAAGGSFTVPNGTTASATISTKWTISRTLSSSGGGTLAASDACQEVQFACGLPQDEKAPRLRQLVRAARR